MSDKKITELPIWARIKALNAALKELEAQQDKAPGYPDLSRVVAFITERLAKVDIDLMPPHLMAEIDSQLSAAEPQIKQLAATASRQHLTQALNHLGHATQRLMTVPQITEPAQVGESFADVIQQTKKAADEAINNIATQLGNFTTQLEQLDTSAKAVEKQQAELDAAIKAAKERSDKVITDYQKQFSDSQNERSQRFERNAEETKMQFKEVLDRLNKEVSDAREALDQQTADLLAALQKRDKETQALARAMGATGVSASFQGTANQNQKAADWLRYGAMALLTIMVGVILRALWQSHDLEPEQTAIRFLGALLVGVPAAYLARESTRQRAEAIRSRRIELELSALGPFIEPLDEATKAALLKELVETYFGRAFDKEDKEEDSLPVGGTLIDLLKATKQLVQK